ncbi:MAG: hypothetical protein K9I94_00260 [Bacteroidales bacterium]|nr:hypothetical protein [Bacteroidales bacterium]
MKKLSLDINGCELIYLPSIHYKVAFAEAANRLCNIEEPEAIAVEVGSSTIVECVNWLREFTGKPSIPVMLGLMRPNNRISIKYKDLLYELREACGGQDISEFSPEFLKEYFSYSAQTLLPLSPSDSIIEAIRCGIELDIPIYGIDLEHIANYDRNARQLVMEDPVNKKDDDLFEYIQRNTKYASRLRSYVDEKREFAMAARLMNITNRYKKVLFVCGLAHWNNLERLLSSGKIKPSETYDAAESHLITEIKNELSSFTRCIVSPGIAGPKYLDIFPLYADVYNRHGRLGPFNTISPVQRTFLLNPVSIYTETFENAIRSYFNDNDHLNSKDKQKDISRLIEFRDFLNNLILVKAKKVPDLYTITKAADGVMSEDFKNHIVNAFMDVNWANSLDYDLPVLLPEPIQNDNGLKVKIQYPDGFTSDHFYIDNSYTRKRLEKHHVYWKHQGIKPSKKGKKEKKDHKIDYYGSNEVRTWPPIDYLITAMTLEARNVAGKAIESDVEEFQGSIKEGIDFRATIKSISRGKKKIYVKENALYAGKPENYNLDPVVWIFDTESNSMSWMDYSGMSNQLNNYFTKRIEKSLEAYYCCAIIYGKDVPCSPEMRDSLITRYMINNGMLYFIPPFFDVQQDAIFVENHSRRLPFYDGIHLSDFFEENFNIALHDQNDKDWHSTLIRIGIKYALQEVTVIVPDNYIIDKAVLNEAKTNRIVLNIAPLSYFPADYINKIRINYGVEVLPGSPGKYPKEAEDFLQEKQDTNRNLVPGWLLDYGK